MSGCRRVREGWWRTGLVLAVAGLPGCVRGSLASDTGPSTVGSWSTAKMQQAHVGEQVRFGLVLMEPFQNTRVALDQWADYAVVHGFEDRLEVEPKADDRFELSHVVRGRPGQEFEVMMEACRIRVHRDYMKMGGQWRRSISPRDLPDEVVARDALKLRLYQSRIEHTLPRPVARLDWDSARLLISRSDGAVSSILPSARQPGGFEVAGPDARGRFVIRHEPLAEQVNKTGTTPAALHARDVNQVQHVYEFEFDTP